MLYRRVPHARGEERAPQAPLGPSRGTVYKLAALFSIDAFAGGFVVQSLLALWLFQRFDLSLSAAALFFFWSSTLGAFSYPVAAWLAKRIGLVNTMVFTHIPSSIFLILAAFAPNLYVALALLLLRSALSQMDVPTRTSYVMAVVTPAERPAAASVTAVPRSLASAISPAIAGALLMTAFPACRWWSAALSRSSMTSRCCFRSGTSSRRRSCPEAALQLPDQLLAHRQLPDLEYGLVLFKADAAIEFQRRRAFRSCQQHDFVTLVFPGLWRSRVSERRRRITACVGSRR